MRRKSIHLVPVILAMAMVSDASADLLGYWRFDENNGAIAADSSGNGHDGTINGAIWTTGKSGSALHFDGVDDYVLCAERIGTGPGVYPKPLMPQTFSVSCWTKLDNFAYFSSFVGNGMDTGDDECGFFLYNWGWEGENERDFGLAIRTETTMAYVETPNIYQTDTWYHLAATYDGVSVRIYVDGSLVAGPTNVGGPIRWISAGSGNYPERFAIGVWLDPGYDLWIDGIIDEVGYWSHMMTEVEIRKLAGRTKASEPSPADGAVHPDTWVNLSWVPGVYAVSHDLHLGDNIDDVTNGTGGTFRGNQTSTYYVAGFPGFAYPDGLVPGTTYYWRIDEVNDANPNSPWKGPVWSFRVAPKKAYNPAPADGAKFVDAAATTLSWTAGFGAKLHTVYFGENHDAVANAAGGLPQGITTYKPAALKVETTYYWRVDEFDAVNTYRGDVWSFTTAKAGGGVKGQYYRGMDFGIHVLTRTDPQINFSWGASAPDPAVGVDNFSVRWTGEVEAAFTETYTFYARADDGVRLWVDGKQLVDAWIDQGATEYSGKVDLVAGNTSSVVMEMYENGGDAVAELRWSSSSTPKELIPQAALSPSIRASGPRPSNGATGTKLTPILRWSPGDFAASHEIYFGIEANAVRSAARTSPEYKQTKVLGNESYDPGKLAWATTYYWRVDEVNNVNPNSPWVGNLWSFTTGDFLVVDDFEDYDAGANQIWYSWHDGLGYGAPGAPPYFAGNGTGAAVGDETTTSYTEQTVVHGGRQAMPLNYDNNKQGLAKYSETELTLTAPRDWTDEGVGDLSLWFRGDSTNVAEPLYVAVSNSAGQPAVVVHDNPAAAQITTWTEWVIPLSALANQGITLTNVDRLAIGLGTRGNMTTPGGSGKMYFDDIRLYRPRTTP